MAATKFTGKGGVDRDTNAVRVSLGNKGEAAKALQGMIDKEGPGAGDYSQYFVFSAARTGIPADKAKAAIVLNSGYKIKYEALTAGNPAIYSIQITRVPSTVAGTEVKPGLVSADDQKPKRDLISPI